MRAVRTVAFSVLCGFLWLAGIAGGQTTTTGQIAGIVRDPSGAVVSGATITASSQAGVDRGTVTDAGGRFTFSVLPPGSYRLVAKKSGFADTTAPAVVVRITETTNLEINLAVAVQTAVVEVHSEQAETPTHGTVIQQEQIRQLPLPTRNFQQLLALTPGTSGPVQNSSELGRGAAPIYVNGNRATSNSVVINGADANSIGTGSLPNLAIPATDTLQEFIVQTSQYDASQGRDSGGIVAAVTKSGTNDFHGNVYEFFRNTVLNANNFFLNRAGITRPPYQRNQFGATLGGPILKDKLWFFISYQGSREVNGTSLLNSVGTVFVPENLTNDRSDAGVDALAASYGLAPCVGTPTGLTFPPCFHPTAKFLLQAKLPNGGYVIPSAPHPVSVAAGSVPQPEATPVVGISRYTENQYNTNLDFQISQANRFSGKFFEADNPTLQALFNLFGLSNALPVPGFGGTADLNQRVLALDDTHVFSPNLVNDARFGLSIITTSSAPQEPFTSAQLGIYNPLGNLFSGMPEISVTNYFDVGANPFSDNNANEKTYTAVDTLSWQKGAHSLKFGAEYKHHDIYLKFNLYTRGQMFFLGLAQSPSPFAGNGFFDFLGGLYDLTGLTIMGSGVNNRDLSTHDWTGYVNDEWRLQNRLTLTLGLRYDFFGQFKDSDGRLVAIDPQKITTTPMAGFPAGDNVAITGGFVQAANAKNPLPDVPEIRSTLVSPNYSNFSPRIGFAFEAVPNRLMVRGGYGIYFDRANARLLNNQVLNFPYYTLAQTLETPISTPFVNVPQPSQFPLKFNDPAIFPYGGPPAFFTQAPSPVSPTGIAVVSANGIYPDIHNFRTPYTQQFSLGTQYAFGSSWMFDLSYVGSLGRKLYRLYDLNQAFAPVPFEPGAYSPGLSSLAVQGFGVHLMQSSSVSNYNSLQASVHKRMANGLQFLAAYTYSHWLDEYSGDPTGTSDVTVVPGNQQILNNYASSDFDRRHRFVFSGIYDLPSYKGTSALLKQAAAGWELASVITLQAGTPFSVLTNATAYVQARADYVPGCNASKSGSVKSRLGEYFNVNCFTPATAVGDFGNSGRNILRGPDQKNVDISIVKFFPIGDKRVEFRSEFFNAFNNVSFANPVNILASANVGQIVSTSTGPRVIQFALKFNF
ncbi:MAG: carboxypeptidase regulatory-like domain-containing protein [Acidobacteriaceae bacterium]|nr:carboxypeptidase regulatory-like domain-containing protein [Acidobacteriaceae bacterium]